MDDITKARHNFVLAFQYCWNGKEFPIFRGISVSEREHIHTGYCAIDLLDEALNLHPDFQEACDIRSEIWQAILANNSRYDYEKYLKSKAWSETRKKFFEQVGRQCICGKMATQVHHKNYNNIGKEELLTDLVGLCDDCHAGVHQTRNPNRANSVRGQDYWKEFETYIIENGNQLQLFPEPDLPSIYGIQIDRKALKSEDRYKDGAFWLVAYRSGMELKASLCMQSAAHYSDLRKQRDIIERQFDKNLGELRWVDNKRWIEFFDNTVGHVNAANRDQEFLWMHSRLVRLHAVFQFRVLELQEETYSKFEK